MGLGLCGGERGLRLWRFQTLGLRFGLLGYYATLSRDVCFSWVTRSGVVQFDVEYAVNVGIGTDIELF